jgi:putative tricarboxylic transport membrane protein
MKINDILAGVLFLALAIGLAAGAWGLPNPSAQPFGPGAFPILISVLLGICSVFLLASSIRDAHRGPLVALADWTRSGPHMLRFLLVPAVVAFYVLFVDILGFLIAAFLILLVLFRAGGVATARSTVLAAGIALLVHTVFYVGLKVQLPWGLLEPIRW